MSCHIAAPVHKCQVADAVSRRRNSVCHAGQNEAALREIPRPPQRARNDNQGNGVRPLSVFVALLALGLAFFAQAGARAYGHMRSEEHTSELQSRLHLVCRLLLEKKKTENPLRISLSRENQIMTL